MLHVFEGSISNLENKNISDWVFIHICVYLLKPILTLRKSLKGTNCTISRTASSPVLDLKTLASPSRNSMAAKSALPTPMMMMDMGSFDACTIASRVSSISLMTPSVIMSSVKYCCRGEEGWCEKK